MGRHRGQGSHPRHLAGKPAKNNSILIPNYQPAGGRPAQNRTGADAQIPRRLFWERRHLSRALPLSPAQSLHLQPRNELSPRPERSLCISPWSCLVSTARSFLTGRDEAETRLPPAPRTPSGPGPHRPAQHAQRPPRFTLSSCVRGHARPPVSPAPGQALQPSEWAVASPRPMASHSPSRSCHEQPGAAPLTTRVDTDPPTHTAPADARGSTLAPASERCESL